MNRLTIVHLYPELLNLYGDRGNVTALAKRCEWRGIPVRVLEVSADQPVNFGEADIVYIGGGADREQGLAKDALAPQAEELAAYVADGGVVLAACGGFHMLGRSFVLNGEEVPGLGVLDMATVPGDERHIGNVAAVAEQFPMPIVGFENHSSLVKLGEGRQPLSRKLHAGFGNNGQDGTEGAVLNNLLGTNLHGPLLPKNPQVADHLIAAALQRKGAADLLPLAPLDDAAEQAANAYMAHRLGA